jgi:phosphatidylserine/phosphatidylglycerophosphate/cardiolipin synthase-like enzyme
MANTGVKGKVADEHGASLNNLRVVAYDVGVIADDSLGRTDTDVDGMFTVWYSSRIRPDLKIRVFDPVGRLLFESDEYSNFSEPVLQVGEIVVPSDVLRGWRVTLRLGYLKDDGPAAPANPFPGLSEGNVVTPLVDNEAAWSALTKHAAISEDFFHLTQLWFNVDQLITLFDPPLLLVGTPAKGDSLQNVLIERNRDHDVTVRLLLNDVIAVPVLFDSIADVKRFLAQSTPNHIEMRGLPRPYNTPLHAKMAVIDGKLAYVLGSPFIQGYFDGQKHLVDEPRRGIASFANHTDNTPLHDVSVSLAGPAAATVNDTFVQLWGSAGAGISKSNPEPSDGQTAVQIVRTIPADLITDVPDGETGVLEAYLRAIGEAKEFIFLDNQYVTEDLIADALVCALKSVKTLEVIMIVNGRVDLPRYNALQPNLLTRMHAALNDEDRSRLGMFTLWSHFSISIPQLIIRAYTHAKVAIVDDKWSTIGTANLDGVSMQLSQHLVPFLPITRSDRRNEREIDINAVIFNGVDELPASTVPADFRRMLWGEHLGLQPEDPLLAERPDDGWLPLWRSRAEMKRKGLIEVPPVGEEPRVLEWRPKRRPTKPGVPATGPGSFMQPRMDPREFLIDQGVTEEGLRHLEIQTGGRSFDFESGKWVN